MNSLVAMVLGEQALAQGAPLRVFDWHKAARLIAERKPRLVSAGLSGDWEYTGGTIYRDGAIVTDEYTYLASIWAEPEIDLDGEVIDCSILASESEGWDSHTKWPESAIALLK
jgi:hypothetical protein